MGRDEGEQDKKDENAPAGLSRFRNVWPRIKSIGRSVTGLSAFGAAVVAIAAWFPLAQDNLWPKEKEYRLLADIHAGYSVDYVKSKLGTPVEVRPASTKPNIKFTLMVFPRDDHIVSIVANDAGEVEMYSVLSCSHDFRPRFDFPEGGSITLQGNHLDQIQTEKKTESDTLLSYNFAVDGQVERATEVLPGSGSASLNGMSYLYGANGVCSEILPPSHMLHQDASYNGMLKDSGQDIRSERQSMTANFYTELAPGFEFSYVVVPPTLPPNDLTWQTENPDQTSYGSISPSLTQREIPPNFLAKQPPPAS